MERQKQLRALITVGLALVMGLALPVAAQVSTGTIEINTVDEQALPMPGVTGRVVNTATGAQRASVSDVAGLIIIPALPPGEYNVGVVLEQRSLSRRGHATVEVRNVRHDEV